MVEENIKNKQIYSESYVLNTDKLAKELKKIQHNPIKQIGNAFHDNLILVGSMISLPEAISVLDHVKHSIYLLGVQEGLIKGISDHILSSEIANEEDIKEYANNTWKTKYEPKIDEIYDKAIRDSKESFSKIIELYDLSQPYKSLLYAGIVFTWCSFEVCMKDLWETALNIGNKLVIKTTLKNITKIDRINDFYGIKGKYINLEYLAQHNYNISDKLGSVLSNKFDFSSVSGIKEAYSCAFPRSTTIKDALENKELAQLEARRHVIVHKAGIIDDAFRKKTATSKKLIGNKLELSDKELSEFGNVAIDAAIKVIKAVSSILSGGEAKS
jgi:hypothetical protein